LVTRGMQEAIRINQAGCLDACEHGPTIVIYPDEVWYGNVQEADVEEIVESHLIAGKVVERLLIRDPGFPQDAATSPVQIET
jgi:(2Fe-2S) ferredoxin